jgi:type I restriction enzyme M protein
LLNGLEVTELKLSEVLQDNDVFRIDGDYFKKVYIANERTLKSLKWSYLQKASNSIKSFGAYSLCNEIEYLDEGIPFLRGQNIKDGTVIFSDCLFINEEANQLLWKSEVKPRMVLLTMSGSVGESAVALEEWNYPINSNQDIAKITAGSNLNPFYLSAFLNCRFGKLQMRRLPVGSVQQHTFIWQLEKIIVPMFSDSFQLQIEKIFRAAHEELEQSHNLYAEAESLLLDELGLKGWQNSDESIAIKSFANSFGRSGRLDAEYYQPKYAQALTKLLKLKPRQIVPLEELLILITNGHTPLYHDLSVGEIPFLTAEHVSDFRINFDSDKRILTEHHKSELKRTQLQEGDVLITIKGRIGNAAVVEHLPRPSNINQDVALLRLIHSIHPFYIVGYLNSVIGKTLINQISTGQINPFLGLGNLRAVSIPLFEEERMNSIGQRLQHKVNQAYATSQNSNQLLDIAKRGVEIAIEQDEAAAIRWIDERLKE